MRERSGPETALLKACSTLEPREWDPDLGLLAALDDDDWRRIEACAGRNGVVGLVARGLAWAEERGGPRAPILDSLTSRRWRRLELQLSRRAALGDLVRRFDAAGVEFVLFKGFVLAEEVYGDLSARGFGDCDLLVRPQAVEPAMAVMAQLGYRAAGPGSVEGGLAAGHHGLPMVREGCGTVDLHWALGDHFPVSVTDLVWREVAAAPAANGLGRLRLSPDLTLLQLAAHYCHHDFEELKPLADFYVAAARLADRISPEHLRDLAGALRLADVLELSVQLCRRRFRARAQIDRLCADPPRRAIRFALGWVAGDDLLRERSPLRHWQATARRRLLLGGLPVFAGWARSWLVPSRRRLAEAFKTPFRWTLYPRYYGVQARRVLSGSPKTFRDFVG